MAMVRRVALAFGGVAALASAVAAAILIPMILNTQDQVAFAISDGDVLDVVGLVVRRIAAICRAVIRLL